jgi:Family of unknown function (DUF6263)
VALRWKFRKGRPYHYVLTTKNETSAKLFQREIKEKKLQTLDVSWKINEVKPDGAATMTQTIDRVRIKAEAPGGSFDADTNQKDGGQTGPTANFAKSMELIIGKPMEVAMSPRGEVLSVKLSDDVTQAMRNAGPGGQALGAVFGEKAVKQMFEQASPVFPEKTVLPGTTWTKKQSMAIAGLGNVEVEATYTDKGEAPNNAGAHQVDGAFKLQYHPPDNPQVNMKVASQDSAAKFIFDMTAGNLSHSEIVQKLQMEVSAGGQSFTSDLTQTITMDLVGEAGGK